MLLINEFKVRNHRDEYFDLSLYIYGRKGSSKRESNYKEIVDVSRLKSTFTLIGFIECSTLIGLKINEWEEIIIELVMYRNALL